MEIAGLEILDLPNYYANERREGRKVSDDAERNYPLSAGQLYNLWLVIDPNHSMRSERYFHLTVRITAIDNLGRVTAKVYGSKTKVLDNGEKITINDGTVFNCEARNIGKRT